MTTTLRMRHIRPFRGNSWTNYALLLFAASLHFVLFSENVELTEDVFPERGGYTSFEA